MRSRVPRAEERPLVLGHRGASAAAPENTMASFRMALDQGADGFELDVWRCRTGEIVVIHDESALRTTGSPLRVPAVPWSELRRLDAGRWKGARFAGERIPLLAEVLDTFPGAVVNVELKSSGRGDPRLAAGVARIARSLRAESRLVVSSFDPLLVAAFRAVAPRVAAGVLFAADQRWELRAAVARALGAASVHPEWTLVTRERAARWNDQRLAIYTWTVDAPAAIEALCHAGVEGLISNVPGVAREAVRRATAR